MFYTYAHYKPEGGLFYIGKGKKKRAYQMDGRNSHWNNIVNKYGKPHVELLASWDTEEEAFSHEKLLIASFRDMGFVLANKTDGGEGSSGFKNLVWNKGIKYTEEQKSKIFNLAEYMKDKPHARLGKSMPKESIEAMRQKKIGKKQTPESIEKRRAKMIGYKHKKVTCPSCSREISIISAKRYHFDNCKLKDKSCP